MDLVFYCQSCGARFEVDARLAGRKARCKNCGQRMTVPRPTELASLVALPAVSPEPRAAHPAGSVAGSRPTAPGVGIVSSHIALVPLSVNHLPPVRKAKPTPLDDDSMSSTPYALAETRRGMPAPDGGARPAGRLTVLWRRQLGSIQHLLRWLNETAYLVSVPFLMMILLGAVLRNRPLALPGATVVLLLNLGRLGVGIANLVVIPFRDGLARGITFLIPPFTFVYLANHWKTLRGPTRRVLGPAATIGLVVIAFTFIPWLTRGGTAQGGPVERLRTGVRTLERDVADEVERARGLDLETLERQAEGSPGTPSPGRPTPEAEPPTPEEAIRNQLRGVGKPLREGLSPPEK